MATMFGDVTGRHLQDMPHLVKKIKDFPLKVKYFLHHGMTETRVELK